MPTEPKNPIRCMHCPLITGVQGLMKHILNHHKDIKWDYNEYDAYIRLNAVKRNDTENPLRYEWRQQNQKK